MRCLAHGSEGGRLLELDGVTAAITPACPARSLVNCSVYRDVDSLAGALPVLADAYEDAGVRGSTVWSLDEDAEAVALLERSGYAFDGRPAAMFLDLSGELPASPEDLDWDAAASPEEVGRVNDRAYGYAEDEGLAPAIGPGPARLPSRFYRARAGGETASVLETIDVEDDCMISWVATLPGHRGRGLAGGLLAAALAEARGRGLETSTLQASMLGRGVYERLGYGLAGALTLHERRE